MRTVLLATMLTLFACTQPPEQRVVARVAGEKIRVGELQAELKKEQYFPAELIALPEGSLAVKKKVLKALIEEKTVLQAARQNGIRLEERQIQQQLESLKSGYTAEEFNNVLKEKGISAQDWEVRQRNKLLVEKLAETVLEPHRPSEVEVKKIYEKRHYRLPEQSHCRQIVTTSREKAETILSLLKRGENFAVLAEKYSESPDREKGGDLGWVGRGELPPIMDEACFRFAPGRTSDIVSSAYGFHIFRVLERKPAERLSLAEARPLIETEWREQHQEEILRNWLKEKSADLKIEIDDKALRETPFSP